MLKHPFTTGSFRDTSSWAALVSPDLVRCKDGSLLGAFRCESINDANANPPETKQALYDVNQVCRKRTFEQDPSC